MCPANTSGTRSLEDVWYSNTVPGNNRMRLIFLMLRTMMKGAAARVRLTSALRIPGHKTVETWALVVFGFRFIGCARTLKNPSFFRTYRKKS